MNDEGHFIDDPLTVVGAKPDFSGMGIPVEHRYAEPLTLQDLIGEIPPWLILLPEDWKGETTRELITMMVSNQAIENDNFDLKGYISVKFVLSLKHIMRKHGMKELHLTQHFTVIVDDFKCKGVTFFYIHIEYEKTL